MATALKELVAHLGGQLQGNPETEVIGIAPLQEANSQHLTFLSSVKFRAAAQQSRAAALILSPKENQLLGGEYAGARIVVDNPYAYFARASQWFARARERAMGASRVGIHPTAYVDASAQVDPSALIGPHATLEEGVVVAAGARIDAGCFVGRNAKIGAGTRLYANVSFHAECEIGARGILHSGAVIGADGFGFANEAGAYIKIEQVGRVVIGDDVEIGANTCIDRGAMADTIIEDGVKLDNLIQIGHNCRIGAHTAMAGCVGVAGSANIGKYCTFGGAAMVLGHLQIADHVHISSGSMVTRSILEAGQYTGIFPLAKNADWEKSAAIVRNLAAMREKIRILEKAVKSLTEPSLTALSLTESDSQSHHE
ncbi:MAG: UDP-3-O-(3-hydroxymyristoyl)glucosamine N-acyltransferase [Burkholderiales bacterium]|nr:UDP-3-O-(3-hydroxymyristoyl)glucosamine N-acyltransferase [Burkholderiales bacterium]